MTLGKPRHSSLFVQSMSNVGKNSRPFPPSLPVKSQGPGPCPWPMPCPRGCPCLPLIALKSSWAAMMSVIRFRRPMFGSGLQVPLRAMSLKLSPKESLAPRTAAEENDGGRCERPASRIHTHHFSKFAVQNFFSDSIFGFSGILHYPRRLLYSVLIHKILLVAYADTLEA